MDKGIESGSGIISSLQGVGSGSSRSLSPWKEAPRTLPIWYCMWLMSFVLFGSGSEHTYQTLCESLELIISFEVLLFVDAYKMDQL